jgi:hypothetical protein
MNFRDISRSSIRLYEIMIFCWIHSTRCWKLLIRSVYNNFRWALIFTIFVCIFCCYYSIHLLFFPFLPAQGIHHPSIVTIDSCIGN